MLLAVLLLAGAGLQQAADRRGQPAWVHTQLGGRSQEGTDLDNLLVGHSLHVKHKSEKSLTASTCVWCCRRVLHVAVSHHEIACKTFGCAQQDR